MDSITSALIGNAGAAAIGSVQGSASVSVLKKALNIQAMGVARLIESVPQPLLATSGPVGTQLNTFA